MLGCVIMAAGNAVRFGANKLEAELDGKPLIRRAFEAVPAGVFDRVVVVTQYPAVAALAREFGFEPVRNDRPGDGAEPHGPPRHAGAGAVRRHRLPRGRPAAAVGIGRARGRAAVAGASVVHRGRGLRHAARQSERVPAGIFPGPVRARGRPRRQRRHPAVSGALPCRRRPAGGAGRCRYPRGPARHPGYSVGNGIQQIENGKGTGKSCAHPPVVRCRGEVCSFPANSIS